jgi:hypothetical protein
MNTIRSHQVRLERDGKPFSVDVQYVYHPGSRGTRMDPPDYPEADIQSVSVDGDSIVLTGYEYEQVEAALLEHEAEDRTEDEHGQ